MSSSGFSPVAFSPSVPPWGTRPAATPPPPSECINAGSVIFEFTQASLVADVFSAVHNLGQPYVLCQLYDDTGALVQPDDQTIVDASTLALRLTSFAPIPGVWHAIIVGSCPAAAAAPLDGLSDAGRAALASAADDDVVTLDSPLTSSVGCH